MLQSPPSGDVFVRALLDGSGNRPSSSGVSHPGLGGKLHGLVLHPHVHPHVCNYHRPCRVSIMHDIISWLDQLECGSCSHTHNHTPIVFKLASLFSQFSIKILMNQHSWRQAVQSSGVYIMFTGMLCTLLATVPISGGHSLAKFMGWGLS